MKPVNSGFGPGARKYRAKTAVYLLKREGWQPCLPITKATALGFGQPRKQLRLTTLMQISDLWDAGVQTPLKNMSEYTYIAIAVKFPSGWDSVFKLTLCLTGWWSHFEIVAYLSHYIITFPGVVA